MINKHVYFLILSFCSVGVFAQGPRVPEKITFADIELKLTNSARAEIQEDVDALHKNAKYFNMKLERVNQYFPIIEKIFMEENVPDDFKYLVIQESALISDAVSSANAVGYWQFKEATGLEVGLRIDRQVDERMNIVSSTHGASRYFKKNNYYLKNWLYALSAYQAGLGGVQQYVNNKDRSAKRMEINKKTHWYFKKYLAHKIAFQDYIGKDLDEDKILFGYTQGEGKSLNEISRELGVSANDVANYNKWLRSGKVPSDKTYTVIVLGYKAPTLKGPVVRTEKDEKQKEYELHDASIYPVIKSAKNEDRNVKVNGIPGIIAQEGEDIYVLIKVGNIELSKFLMFNEIDITHEIVQDEVYYLKKKKGKGKEYYHIVYPGETLWTVSQKYGMRLRNLMSKNRIKEPIDIKPGRILWLRYIRPSNVEVEYKEIDMEQPVEVVPEKTEEVEVKETENDDAEIEKSPELLVVQQDENQNLDSIVVDMDQMEKSNIVHKGIPEEYTAELEDDQLLQPAFHLVEAGETLYALSKKYNIPIEQLLTWNDIELEDGIKTGQKIYLKKPYFQQEKDTNLENETKSYIDHQVIKGETLYSLSRKYNVTVEQIQEWNNKQESHISIGEILRIYTGG